MACKGILPAAFECESCNEGYWMADITEPPEQVKNEIAALKADKSIPQAEKKEDLA
jgi:hypothetical protein